MHARLWKLLQHGQPPRCLPLPLPLLLLLLLQLLLLQLLLGLRDA